MLLQWRMSGKERKRRKRKKKDDTISIGIN